jgi:SAM-dependent methyltransferase
VSQVIRNCATVLDLGCGPATQLAQIAELNPDIRFLGVDLSEQMLASARDHVTSLGLTNVEFAEDDISRLQSIESQSVDGVISTMALHHLPTMEHLRSCFEQLTRVLRPGGAVYLVDFGRLKSLKSVLFFAYMNRDRQPHIFSLDYERSLRAAFLFEDFKTLAADVLPADTQVLSTFKMPILTLIKSADHPLPDPLASRIRDMRKALPARYLHDLDDLRVFFGLGGLRHDPFA